VSPAEHDASVVASDEKHLSPASDAKPRKYFGRDPSACDWGVGLLGIRVCRHSFPWHCPRRLPLSSSITALHFIAGSTFFIGLAFVLVAAPLLVFSMKSRKIA
jgi:hypothetical protein